MSSPGAPTEARPADENVQTLVDKVKGSAEEKCDKKFAQFKAESYSTQLVAGTNYFVKVSVGDDQYIHIRIFCALPHENRLPELVAIQEGKTKDDSLEYFSA